MTMLRTERHAVKGTSLCEVWKDGQMIATIYPTDRGVKVVSKHIENRDDLVTIDPGEAHAVRSFDGRALAAIVINILPPQPPLHGSFVIVDKPEP